MPSFSRASQAPAAESKIPPLGARAELRPNRIASEPVQTRDGVPTTSGEPGGVDQLSDAGSYRAPGPPHTSMRAPVQTALRENEPPGGAPDTLVGVHVP